MFLGSLSLWEQWVISSASDYPGGWWSPSWWPSEADKPAEALPKFNTDIHLLNPSALVELYSLEYEGITLRFHSGVTSLGSDVIWQGNTYTRYPIEATGFELTSKGTLPRPRIKAANISGVLSQLAKDNDDLVGAKLTRHRTFFKYLDEANFPGVGNVNADPLAEFPLEIWYIDKKAAENPIYVEWELTAPWDVVGIKLPRRQIVANICPWIYRSAECGYAGDAVADKFDNPTTDISKDQCAKRLSSCKLRFVDDNTSSFGGLPFGGFPSVGLIR